MGEQVDSIDVNGVACPTCGAASGVHCAYAGFVYHQEREDAWRAIASPDEAPRRDPRHGIIVQALREPSGVNRGYNVESIMGYASVEGEPPGPVWLDSTEGVADVIVRALAASAAAAQVVTSGDDPPLPGCTGDYECPAPAHQHGCMGDTLGHCNDPGEHWKHPPTQPSVEDVVKVLREATYSPHVKPEHLTNDERLELERQAAAVLALFPSTPAEGGA